MAEGGNGRWNTQIEAARLGIVTAEMKQIAKDEYLTEEQVLQEIASGKMIIPANSIHKKLYPKAIGSNATCKINANIGNSSISSGLEEEINKLKLCIELGTDAVMDLSTGESIKEIRQALIDNSTVPLGTVPIYEAMELVDDATELTPEILLKVIEEQAAQGVDFMTIHAGILWRFMPMAAKRKIGIVSRGGSILAKWMMHHKKENPLYTNFDKVLDICYQYDVAISLGDGLRPGCLADASDKAQFAELKVLGELTRRCWEKNVQVMVEGPGHVPFDQIAMNVEKQIELCDGAPFYVLGPIVTDIAPGYDHITSSIGATMAAYSGAAMLCYVTPSEHLGLPNLEDVRHGIIAYKIAAHAADIARKKPKARERDDRMSEARYGFDWDTQFKLALDPKTAKEKYDASICHEAYSTTDYCSMCGPKFCAMRISKEAKQKMDMDEAIPDSQE